MTKHPKTRDERLYIDAKKNARKQATAAKRKDEAIDNQSVEE